MAAAAAEAAPVSASVVPASALAPAALQPGSVNASSINLTVSYDANVTLHYGDIMHAAPPPTGAGPFRKCALLSYARADAYNHRGESSYNDVLLSREDGQVEHLAKVARRA